MVSTLFLEKGYLNFFLKSSNMFWDTKWRRSSYALWNQQLSTLSSYNESSATYFYLDL